MTSRIVHPDPQVVFRRLGDKVVLVHLHTNQILELNETAARLWELLSEDGDVRAAEVRLSEEYDVDPGQLRTEVEATVALLTTEKMMVEAGDA